MTMSQRMQKNRLTQILGKASTRAEMLGLGLVRILATGKGYEEGVCGHCSVSPTLICTESSWPRLLGLWIELQRCWKVILGEIYWSLLLRRSWYPNPAWVGEETGDFQCNCSVTGQSRALLWLALKTPCAHPYLPSHRGNKQLMVRLGSVSARPGSSRQIWVLCGLCLILTHARICHEHIWLETCSLSVWVTAQIPQQGDPNTLEAAVGQAVSISWPLQEVSGRHVVQDRLFRGRCICPTHPNSARSPLVFHSGIMWDAAFSKTHSEQS